MMLFCVHGVSPMCPACAEFERTTLRPRKGLVQDPHAGLSDRDLESRARSGLSKALGAGAPSRERDADLGDDLRDYRRNFLALAAGDDDRPADPVGWLRNGRAA